MNGCECDWQPAHRGQACTNEAADLGAVQMSPALCLPCLYGCTEDERAETELATIITMIMNEDPR